MDSFAACAYSSSAAWFLQVAAHAKGHLDEAGLGVWSVRDLLGHTGRALSTVENYLDAARWCDFEVDLEDAAAYYLATQGAMADVEAVTERGRAAGAALGGDPVAALSELAARALARVADADDDAMVITPFGVMTLEGYLPTRVVELSVHTCDVAEALGIEAAVPPEVAQVAFAVLGSLAAASNSAAPALLALTGRRSLPQGYSLM